MHHIFFTVKCLKKLKGNSAALCGIIRITKRAMGQTLVDMPCHTLLCAAVRCCYYCCVVCGLVAAPGDAGHFDSCQFYTRIPGMYDTSTT